MKHMGDLSNDELLAELGAHVRTGHVWCAELIAYLVEVEQRRLHLERAYSSMWDFCLRGYGMSENEAQLRLVAVRIVQRFPIALGCLERGELHLSALSTLRDALTPENHEELLRAAAGKSVRAIERMLAERSPKPDVPDAVEPVAPQAAQAPLPVLAPVVTMPPSLPEPRACVAPLSATRYRIELTVSADVKAKLDRVKDLMRHRNPRGDLEPILDCGLDLLVDKLEREVLGKTSRPRRANAQTETAEKKRAGRVARSVRREVFARDGEQCTYTDESGNRCPARTLLELDHVEPRALGGDDTTENLRVRCARHNRLAAEQVFGRAHVAKKVAHSHYGRAKCAPEKCAPEKRAPAKCAPAKRARAEHTSAKTLDTAASALKNLGFHDPDVRRTLATLGTKLDPNETSLEAIVREALRLLSVPLAPEAPC